MHLLEEEGRLSQSVIWDMQKRYYERMGIDAWNTGAIPSHMSSNAFVAWSYSRLIEGFIRDCRRRGFLPEGQKVTILELGAGSGRLGWLIEKNLRAGEGAGAYRYLMTDVTSRNIEAWTASGAFAEALAGGRIRFTEFDVDRPEEADNLAAALGEPNLASGPMVVIANYVADSLRQDMFGVTGGELFEIEVAAATETESDPTDRDILRHVRLATRRTPVEFPRYDTPHLDNVLRAYRDGFGDTAFLVPIGLIECITRFQNASLGPLMLLLGDKGRLADGDIAGQRELPLVLHDSGFSFTVNMNALDRLWRLRGGVCHFSDDPDRGFIIGALLSTRNLTETARAFADSVMRFGPRDISRLMDGLDLSDAQYDLETLLGLLKLSRYEPRILLQYRRRITSAILALPAEQIEMAKPAVTAALEAVWENHYPLGISRDVPYAIGRVHDYLGDYGQAAAFYDRSLASNPENVETLYRLARACRRLGETGRALETLGRLLEIEPGHENAEALRARLISE